MGADAIGTKSKMAIKKGTTWGTAVDLGANDRVPFVSCGLINEPQQIQDDTITDATTRRPSLNGNHTNEGPLVVQADYRQHLLMNALLFGSAGVPTGPVDTAAYTHTMKFQKSVQGRMATIAIDKGGVKTADGSKKCEAWASVKPQRMTFVSTAGDKAMETFDLVAAGYFDTEDPVDWTYPAATSPENGGGRTLVHARQVCRVNLQAGGALGSGDRIYPNRVELVFDRAFGRSFSQGVDVEEPVPDGWQEITVRLDFFTAKGSLLDLFRDARDAETLLKMDLAYTHTKLITGAASTFYSRTFYFPKLRVTRCPLTVDGPGAQPYRVEMTAHLATAAPTGFPVGCVEECWQQFVNEISTDPLA